MENFEKEKLIQKVEMNSRNYYFSEQQMGIDNKTKQLVMRQLVPYLNGPQVLELGFVDGMFTDILLDMGLEITILEGAEKHINYAKTKYEHNMHVTIVHDYFETFEACKKYNTIVAGDMIQYLEDPIGFFAKAKTWLTDDGSILVSTPNRRSFHRRMGAYMGFSTNPEEVSETEKATGNIMMYDNYQLRDVLFKSGLNVHFVRGCFLKPFSSKQMEHWDEKLLNALLAIGNELGDYCWFLIAYCTKK